MKEIVVVTNCCNEIFKSAGDEAVCEENSIGQTIDLAVLKNGKVIQEKFVTDNCLLLCTAIDCDFYARRKPIKFP